MGDEGERRKLYRRLRKQGWRLVDQGDTVRCIPPDPDAKVVFLRHASSDGRALRRAVRQLMQSGYVPPERESQGAR